MPPLVSSDFRDAPLEHLPRPEAPPPASDPRRCPSRTRSARWQTPVYRLNFGSVVGVAYQSRFFTFFAMWAVTKSVTRSGQPAHFLGTIRLRWDLSHDTGKRPASGTKARSAPLRRVRSAENGQSFPSKEPAWLRLMLVIRDNGRARVKPAVGRFGRFFRK